MDLSYLIILHAYYNNMMLLSVNLKQLKLSTDKNGNFTYKQKL